MAADKHFARSKLSNGSNGILQSCPIASCVSRPGRPIMPQLAVRELATQDRESNGSKGLRERDQQRRLGIGPCTVGEDKAVGVRVFGAMQKTVYGRLHGIIGEWRGMKHDAVVR